MTDTANRNAIRSGLGFGLMMALISRPYRRWLVWGVALLAMFFVTAGKKRDAYGVLTGGIIWRPWSYALFAAFVLEVVGGVIYIEAIYTPRHSQRQQAMHYSSHPVVHAVAPQAPVTIAPVAPVLPQELRTEPTPVLVPQRRVRSVEDHGTFMIRDWRPVDPDEL